MSQPKHYIVKKDPIFCEECDYKLGEHRWESVIFNRRRVFCTEKCGNTAWKNRFKQKKLNLIERK